ncbi:MAG: DEAD/DEAH box helicase [Deferribacterales bacterium]
MNFYEEQSQNILNNDGYKEISHKLFNAYILKMLNREYELPLPDIKKLVTSIQFFYMSGNDRIVREGTELLSMLLEVAGRDYDTLITFANYLFTESGDFPNTTLINERYPDSKLRLNFFDEFNMDIRREVNSVPEIGHVLTDYQRCLWGDLTKGHDVLTSAPTSTGKTYIILKYIINSILNSDGAFAAIVVPSRALITEVSKNIYDILKGTPQADDVEIVTVPNKENKIYKDKTFFVMTQERLFEILQAGDIYFNFLFIDEAHNIASKDRGVLLHLTLQKLLEDSTPQIIISMPSQEYQNSFDSVFDVKFKKRITNHSSVAKIIISVALQSRNMTIEHFNTQRTLTTKKGFKGSSIEDIANHFGKNDINIIFRNGKASCESTANALTKLSSETVNDQALEEAADYVENFLHPKFTLANNLRHGIAFHYGSLPSTTRLLIESLMREGKIKFIACTSTLAEGINLPAKNLFLFNPKISGTFIRSEQRRTPDKKIEDVQIKNIIGRAGRMLKHFSGNVFLITPENWDFDYDINDTEEKTEKIPTYFELLNTDLDGIISVLQGDEIDTSKEVTSYYSIANKLIGEYENETLSRTFEAKELILDKDAKESLLNKIKQAHSNLTIDPFTMSANPTIGYIQQNTLYNYLNEQNDLSLWTLPHPESGDVYNRLFNILNELINMQLFLPTESRLGFLTTIACKWFQGKHLKEIIIEHKDRNPESTINKCIREVIKLIDSDIRFKMAYALKCYDTILSNIIFSKKLDLQTVKLHSYIEVGGCKERFIDLVRLGLSREASIEINNNLSSDITIKSSFELKKAFDEQQLEILHPVIKKEINNLLN